MVSDTKITANAPFHAPGAVDVVVTTPNGTSDTRAADTYYYYATTAPTATVTGVAPASGSSSVATPVKITGTTLSTATQAAFTDPSNANKITYSTFVVVSPTEIDSVLQEKTPGTPGTATIGAATQENGNVTTAASTVSFAFTAVPTVTDVNPDTGPAAGGTNVTITGTGFDATSTVMFGDTPAQQVSYTNSTTLVAISPQHAAGTVDVTVTSKGGTSKANPNTSTTCNPASTQCGDSFTFTAASTVAPTVTGVSPTSGPAAGGTQVTITGTGFTGATGVKFGSAAATNVTVVSATSITATSPAGTGMVDVTVTTPNGTSATSPADQFTYAPTAGGGDYNPVTPTRILSEQAITPNQTYTFTLPSSVPAGSGAIALNLTAITPDNVGNLRVYPACGGTTPTGTSIVNYQPGQTVANFVVVPLQCSAGAAPVSAINFYSANANVKIDVDLEGTYPTTTVGTGSTATSVTAGFTGVGPTRDVTAASIPANGSKQFTLTGLPAGAKAVALNATVHAPTGGGNLRVYPGDQSTTPNTSNVNYVPGVDKSSFVIVNLPANGSNTINIYSAGVGVTVDVDVFGAFPAGASTTGLGQPVRVLDTRGLNGAPTQGLPSPLATGKAYNVTVTGQGVPANATAVVVSLTAIHATGSSGVGNLRAYPAGASSVPNVSNINYIGPSADVANLAIVKIGTGGQISLVTNGSVMDVAVDVLGYVPAQTATP